METKFNNLWKLFFTFLKLSLITFGGGYAMISLIEIEVVKKHGWIKENEIIDVFTVAQTVPGAVAINSAIFIGYRVSGLVGAIIALLGIMLPTLVIVIIVSFSYNFFRDNSMVKAAFNGIGAAVIALIVHAGYTVGRTAITDITTLFITLLSIVILLFFGVNPVLVIILGFVIGVIIPSLKAKRKERARNEMKSRQKDYNNGHF